MTIIRNSRRIKTIVRSRNLDSRHRGRSVNTPHNVGMMEQRKVGSKDRVTVGKVQKVESRKVGSVAGILTDKKERK